MLEKKNNIYKWELLLKVFSEEIAEDNPLFQHWLHADTENLKLYLSLKTGEKNSMLFDKDKVFHNISSKLCLDTSKKKPLHQKKCFKYTISSIAIIALLIVSYCSFYVYEKKNSENIEESVFKQGSKKAYLLSKEGVMIDLSESFKVEKEDGTIITNKKSEGIISYHDSKSDKKIVEYQTLYVPKSGEYELALTDGSKVFLNSESQLMFPSYFEGDARIVKLLGEAYFEVNRDVKPFIIQTQNLIIKVLGTSLNINTYETNQYVNTTLVNGSIQIHLPEQKEIFLLEPGQNFRFDKLTNEVSVQAVNTDLYTSWIKGEFVFRDQPLIEIFAQLKRWYDFEIIYGSPGIEKMRFTGSVEKARPLDYMLDMIQAVTDIQYKTDGDKIILYK